MCRPARRLSEFPRASSPVDGRRNWRLEHLMQIWIEAIFWASLAAVAYAYAVYPALIYCLSRCFGHEPSAQQLEDAGLPVVSLLIAAHNEEAVIEQRILNALAMD